MGEAELGEHGAGGGEPEVLHQVLAQQPHGHRIQEDRALAGEADEAPFRIQFKQFLVVQIIGSHGQSRSFKMKDTLLHFEGMVNFM